MQFRRPLKNKICCSRCLYFRNKDGNNLAAYVAQTYTAAARKSLSVSLAFLMAFILYFPANILPIMISSNPTALEINTIFNGIVYMWNDGDRLIAVIIFSASIMVPVLKIIAMAVLVVPHTSNP